MNSRRQSTNKIIASQKRIRVYPDVMPGSGDQAACASIMDWLRVRGFNGIFEVVYSRAIADKIFSLFGLHTDTPSSFYDKDRNIHFVQFADYYANYLNNAIEPVVLALSAGKGDNFCVSADIDDGIIINSKICNNDATMMNARMSIVISPWMTQSAYQIIRFPNRERIYLQDGGAKFFTVPSITFAEAKSYLEVNVQGQEFLAKKPALKTLMEGIEKNKFNVLPVYGYPIQKVQHNEENPNYLANILGIIAGARYAQLNGQNDLHKPLIIPVFYNYDVEMHEVTHFINEPVRFEVNGTGIFAAKQALQDLHLPSAFSTISIDSPNAQIKINNLNQEQILLISLGSAPQNLFKGLFMHNATNILPQFREGQMSLNNLLTTGKAHFRCGGTWEPSYIGYGPKDKMLQETFKHLYGYHDGVSYQKGFICAGFEGWNRVETPKAIGECIIQAQNSTSALSQYFKWLQSEAVKSQNDRNAFTLDAGFTLLGDQTPECEHVVEEEQEASPQSGKPIHLTYGDMIDPLLTLGVFSIVTVKKWLSKENSPAHKQDDESQLLEERTLQKMQANLTAQTRKLRGRYEFLNQSLILSAQLKRDLYFLISECEEKVADFCSGKTTERDLNDVMYLQRYLDKKLKKLFDESARVNASRSKNSYKH